MADYAFASNGYHQHESATRQIARKTMHDPRANEVFRDNDVNHHHEHRIAQAARKSQHDPLASESYSGGSQDDDESGSAA